MSQMLSLCSYSQEPPLLTEDLIKETEEFVLRTGRLAKLHKPFLMSLFLEIFLCCVSVDAKAQLSNF